MPEDGLPAGQFAGDEEGRVGFGAGTRWRAFISYRRKSARDRWLAHLLQSKLEKYRTPKRLVRGSVRRRAGPVFLDREELWSGLGLKQSLQEAIAKSDFLIVICSPEAAPRPATEGPDYIQQEISLFRAKPDSQGRVLPVLSSGDPNILGEMNVHGSGDETLAVDLRGWRRRRPLQDRSELLGLLAPLVDCGFAVLRDRERRRARLRELVVILAAVFLAGVASVAVWGWWEAIAQRNVANERLEDVLEVGRLVFTVADQELRQVHGAAEVRERLTTAAGEIVERLLTEEKAAVDPTVLRVRSLGHTAVGDEAWAEGEVERAVKEYEVALTLDENLLKLDPDGAERHSDLAVSHGKLVRLAAFSGDLEQLELHARGAMHHAEEAVRRAPGVVAGLRLLAAAHGDLATHAVMVAEWGAARRHLAEEMRLATQAARIEPEDPRVVSVIGESYVKLARLEVEAGDVSVAWEFANAAVEHYQSMRERFEDNPEVLRGLYVSLLTQGQAAAALGRPEDAISYLSRALVLAEDQLARQPRDMETRSWLGLIEAEVFSFEMQAGREKDAARSIQRACALVEGSKDLRVRRLQKICEAPVRREPPSPPPSPRSSPRW